MIIQLEHIGRIYRKGRVDVVALRAIDLSIADGEFVAIMGPSGSGKSTLLHILGCLDCPSEGRYLLDGIDATTLDDPHLSALRNQKIGFIFQSFYLLPQQTVLQNIATPILYGQPAAETRVAYQRRARQLAEQVGLGQRLHHRPSELSGGEVQRVAIARALVVAPRVILADEPTGNLDSRTGQEIMALLSGLHAQGHTILLVTHEPHVAEYADRIIFLKDGEIERDTAREEQKSRRTASGTRKAEQQNSRTAEAPMAEGGKQNAGEQNSRRAEKPIGLLFLPSSLFTFFPSAFRLLPSAFYLLPAAFDTAIHGVLIHKFRSLLSVLGIVFGIGAIIAMLAIGSGAKQEILEQIALLGMTNITVTAIPPPDDAITTSNEQLSLGLTTSDAERLRQGSPYIASLAAVRHIASQIQYNHRLLQVRLVGTTADYLATANLRLQQGRFLTTADERELQRVCVLGAEVRQTLFAFKNPIGELVKIRHDWYRVVGTLANKNLDSEKFPTIQLHNVNLDVYIPLSTSGMFLPPAESQRIQEISIRVTASERVDAVAHVIRTILTRVHHGARDYDVMVPRELLQQHQQTQQVFNLVMGCIAGISLLVGGIGIMNIMLATVTERTKEIGIRRAIGASRQMILLQFLFETLLLTCIGGMLGILLGSGGAAVISMFAQWRTVIDITIIGLAVGISTAIGIIFGLFPAIQGANMDPIAALRYE